MSTRKQWESILKTVSKDEVPVELLESMTVNLKDGSKVHIHVKELIDEGIKPKDIERHVNEKLEALDEMIIDVDFFICIESVAKTVQPVTDKLLSNLKL